MPISHPHKTIFVHIPKTAGTSIEAVLGMHGDKQDIGIVPYFNQTLDYEHLYGGPMQHMTMRSIRAVLQDEAIFRSYFKFAIVRNPWDRLVSALAWSDQKWVRKEELSVVEFEREVHRLREMLHAPRPPGQPLAIPPFLCPQSLYVLDQDGTLLVDFIGRYERLDADWLTICRRLGIEAPLPRRMRSHHRDYRDYYTEETRRLVGEMFASDMEAFEYSF